MELRSRSRSFRFRREKKIYISPRAERNLHERGVMEPMMMSTAEMRMVQTLYGDDQRDNRGRGVRRTAETWALQRSCKYPQLCKNIRTVCVNRPKRFTLIFLRRHRYSAFHEQKLSFTWQQLAAGRVSDSKVDI